MFSEAADVVHITADAVLVVCTQTAKLLSAKLFCVRGTMNVLLLRVGSEACLAASSQPQCVIFTAV